MSENKGCRDTPRSRVVNDAYSEGYDRIFGKDHKPSGTQRIRQSSDVNAPAVMGDMAPYKSPLDGKMITSRSQHRAHLREHGVVEVGNEKMPEPKGYQPNSKEIINDLREAREMVRNLQRYSK